VNEGIQNPTGGPTGGPGPFDEIFNLGLPAATAPAVMPSPPIAESVAPKSRRRPLIIGIVCVVVLAAVVIPAALVFSAASAAISSGNGTATISWTSAPDNGDSTANPPQSFSGSINGNALSGQATFSVPAESTIPPPGTTSTYPELPFFHYKGSYAGKPFVLGVSIDTHGEGFVVNGIYDGQVVNAVVGPSGGSSLNSSAIPFHGTIGSWQIVGTISFPTTGTNGKQTASATFTVSA
jgi:hypothetical protein